MPSQWQTIPVDFRGGVDTKSDKKDVIPGKLLKLENASMSSFGKIQKRNGYDKLSQATGDLGSGNSVTGEPRAIFEQPGGGLVMLGSDGKIHSRGTNTLWASRSYASTDSAVEAEEVDPVSIDVRKISALSKDRGYSMASNVDIAANDKYALIGVGNEDAYFYLMDLATGEIINSYYANTSIVGGWGCHVKCLNMGGKLRGIHSASSDTVRMIKLNEPYEQYPDDPWGNNAQLATDAYTDGTFFDVGVQSDGTGVLVYRQASTGYTVVKRFDETGSAVGSSYTNTTDTISYQPTLSVDSSDQVYVGYGTATAVRWLARSSDLQTQVSAETTAYTYSGDAPTTMHWLDTDLYFTIHDNTTFGSIIYKNSSATEVARGLMLAARPYLAPSTGTARFICATVSDGEGQEAYVIVNEDGALQGHFLPGEGYETRRNDDSNSIGSPVVLDDDRVLVVLPSLIGLASSFSTLDKTAAAITTIDYNHRPQSVTAAGSTYLNAGFLAQINATDFTESEVDPVVEAGFIQGPHASDMSATEAASGSLETAGTYSVLAVYEWTDHRGRLHYSIPSTSLSVTLTSTNKTIDVVVPTLRVTRKYDVQIVVYRTEDGGSIFYEDRGTPNDKTTDSVTISLTQADSDLITNKAIYTTGGVLDNYGPPHAKTITTHRDRVFLTDSTGRVWYSKKHVSGIGLEFAGEQTIYFDDDVVPYGLDDRVLFFGKQSISALSGDGPNSLGVGTFSPPRKIYGLVGCDNPRSIARTDAGVFFESSGSLYLIDRGFAVSPAGDEIAGEMDGKAVRCADVVPLKDEVRFLLDDAETVLIYDIKTGAWGVHKFPGAVACTVWDGDHVLAKGNGTAYRQGAGFKDDGLPYSMAVGTSWLKLTGPQGFYRARRFAVLGGKKTHHKLKVLVYYDYEDEPSQTVIFDAKEGIPAGSDVLQFRARLNKQKCQAIRFEFVDLDQSDSGEGYSISDLTLEAAPKRGINRLGKGQTA